MKAIKKLVVHGLSVACTGIDRLPQWTWKIPFLHRLGCPGGMALWSSNLDERWNTGLWKPS